jgi:hypothetical protein
LKCGLFAYKISHLSKEKEKKKKKKKKKKEKEEGLFPSCPDQIEIFKGERELELESELELEEKNQRKRESVLLPNQNKKEEEERRKEREGRIVLAGSLEMSGDCVSSDMAADRPSIVVGRPPLMVKMGWSATPKFLLFCL